LTEYTFPTKRPLGESTHSPHHTLSSPETHLPTTSRSFSKSNLPSTVPPLNTLLE
jgi:hypothetical protein